MLGIREVARTKHRRFGRLLAAKKKSVTDPSINLTGVIFKVRRRIADCFVTGNWDKSEDAQARLDRDGESGQSDASFLVNSYLFVFQINCTETSKISRRARNTMVTRAHRTTPKMTLTLRDRHQFSVIFFSLWTDRLVCVYCFSWK